MKSSIVVRGARQHNLKGFDLEIPRRTVTVITGPSGSGKSSLALDTIYAEGQRRYVESLSAYARQFLERMEKPDVDSIDGLSPAVAIEQKNPARTARSTVGTATEIYDYLRLLWARIGHTFCSRCEREMRPDTVQSVTDRVLALPAGTRFAVAFPLRLSAEVTHEVVVENLRAQGFVRVMADGISLQLDEVADRQVDLTSASELLVIVDRLVAAPEASARLADAIGTAFAEGDSDCTILFHVPVRWAADGHEVDRLAFTERFECAHDGTRAPAPSPRLFSFNSPQGACTRCNGFGAILEYDESLIVPYPDRSLAEGAIHPWTMPRYDGKRRALREFAKRHEIPLAMPWRELSQQQRDILLHGAYLPSHVAPGERGRQRATLGGYKPIFPFLRDLETKRYKQYIRVFLRQYQKAQECPDCRGARLNSCTLNVRVADRNIADVSVLSMEELDDWLRSLELSEFEQNVAEHVLREARNRTRFMVDVGLGYLSLDRATRSLSGGEAQRIGLANSLGSQLVDPLYGLDEPSIGLHARDMQRLLALMHRLRGGGNTVLVVEHDLEAIRSADYMVELGPASGEHGGHVVFAGPLSRANESPLTGQYLSGARTVPIPEERRRLGPRWLTLTGAREHNLRSVDVRIPLGALTVVTGVSGSGKSTLVHDVLFRALETRLHGEHTARQHLGEPVGALTAIEGHESLEDVVLMDQEPIGRSPRSNPVTYVKAFEEIRRIFADTPLARQRRYTPGTFSFNVQGGRCEECEGAGSIEVEMLFMADVFVPCDECGGKRFKPDVLEVRVRGKNVRDVLELTVDEAIRFFPREEKLGQALWQLHQVGLGYLRLGQASTTLSGGEAQRIKIARELVFAGRRPGRKLYIMDEPTTGLHLEDIRKLASVIERLVDRGNTVLLIEHNLDVIKLADWVIDLGPEGGTGGGEVVATGRPEEIARVDASHTGRWLRSVLPGYADSRGGEAADDTLRRTHAGTAGGATALVR
ncbi:MAG: excinuclease ABC subunit UvrA [Gemmatimonadaceae bacterium]